jgi:valyl-tRNA synthetase
MDETAKMNDQAGPFAGLDRFEAREKVLAALKEKGLFEKEEDHATPVGRCDRCDTIIEPYLSEQWFVDMKPLAAPAIEAVKSGRVRFHPDRWAKVYLDWMENIQDWCVSRQIWWGHRMPVWTFSWGHAGASFDTPATERPAAAANSARIPTFSTRGSRARSGRSRRWAGPRRRPT